MADHESQIKHYKQRLVWKDNELKKKDDNLDLAKKNHKERCDFEKQKIDYKVKSCNKEIARLNKEIKKLVINL
ncbi:hypothetical protein [Pseudoalteromonas piscicida]|uniref:hypothetical protein n=1 Tax=Pseudoalteromonas piscicida TaxID=43662 RepID=UPI0030B6F9AC